MSMRIVIVYGSAKAQSWRDAIAAQLRQGQPRKRHDLMRNLGMRCIVFFELGDQAEMQMAPLAHDFLLIVAMVPAMESMVSRQFFLDFCRLDSILFASSAEIPFEGVEYAGYMIVELRARERACIAKRYVLFHRRAPLFQNAVASPI